MDNLDLVVIGGGVIGCATLRACLEKFGSISACLIEKASDLALHQSGRNSGVVHVGYNQKPGSVKAKYVVEGSRRLRHYCREHNIPVVEDGILVVARNDQEKQVVDELWQRGRQNGAQVEIVEKDRLLELEPEAYGIQALYAREGASFDARGYVISLARQAQERGAQLFFNETVEDLKEKLDCVEIKTSKRVLRTKVLVCAAGLYADRLAHKLGLGLGFHMVPFRGEYHELVPERRFLVRSHIYPAPDLKFPFLGVHLSRTFDGRVLVGPGAVLALGRESYRHIEVNLKDVIDMLSSGGFWKLWLSEDFRRIAKQEWKKSLFSGEVTKEARALVPKLEDGDLVQSRAGIRAQLVSSSGQLVEDLVVEESAHSIHVLNAVSPALTCSLPFADYLCKLVGQRLGQASKLSSV